MKKSFKELDQIVDGWLEVHRKKKENQDFMDALISMLDDASDLPSYDVDTIIKSTCVGFRASPGYANEKLPNAVANTATENNDPLSLMQNLVPMREKVSVCDFIEKSNEAIMLGATDTTTVTLTWALSLLINNPDVLNKAQQELNTQVGRERPVEESDVKDLVYLQAITKEVMRLYPASPLSVPHESSEDCTLSGYHIPAGTRLLVNLSKLLRDPDVWPEPNEFRPERFLTTHKNFNVRGANFEYIPFGTGRRVCPGISFSLQVMHLALAKLLHGFEISSPTGGPVDMVEGVGLTNLKANPLELHFTPRLPSHLYD
ncbi:cytochrome P450 82A3-like [Tripterygium wilfordii]|uniref:cytochrome P450 82A3-like n=1 Tax=Tripterygium wilfordii TaxID=458696 RepID=UPI0018F837B8|nr:cytochrome P450 82A3-like [Tripterygium wilfordii]